MNLRLRTYKNSRSRRNRDRSDHSRWSPTTAQQSQNYYANFFQAANVPFATFESLEQLTIPLVRGVPNEYIWLRSILVPVLDVEPMEFERCRGGWGRSGGRGVKDFKPFRNAGQPLTSIVVTEEQTEASPGPSHVVRVESEPRDEQEAFFKELTWADILCWSYSEQEEALEPEERAKRKEKEKLKLEREAAELRRAHQISERRLKIQKERKILREEQRQLRTSNFKPRYKFNSDKKGEITSSLAFPVSTGSLTVAEFCESETRLEYLEGYENDDLTPEPIPIYEIKYETGEDNPAIDDDPDILVIGLTREEMEEF